MSTQAYVAAMQVPVSNETENLPPDALMKRLLHFSIKQSSHKTYGSAVSTMRKFLQKIRDDERLPEVATMTEEEFVRFLHHLLEAGSASANVYRSALVFEQRKAGKATFAADAKFLKATKGAATNAKKVHKAVLSLAQLAELQELLEHAVSFFVPPCKHCEPLTPEEFNKKLYFWALLQFSGNMRIGELEKLRIKHKVTTTEYLEGTADHEPIAFQVNKLVFDSRKNEAEGGLFRINETASTIFDFLASMHTTAEGNTFLVPRCAGTHIGRCLEEAALALQWPDDVVWCTHSLRHSAMTAFRQKIYDTTMEYVCQVTARTADIYSLRSFQPCADNAPVTDRKRQRTQPAEDLESQNA